MRVDVGVRPARRPWPWRRPSPAATSSPSSARGQQVAPRPAGGCGTRRCGRGRARRLGDDRRRGPWQRACRAAGRATAPAPRLAVDGQGHVDRPVAAAGLAELPGAVERVDDPHPLGVEAAQVVAALLGQDGVAGGLGLSSVHQAGRGPGGRPRRPRCEPGEPVAARPGARAAARPASVAARAASAWSSGGGAGGRHVDCLPVRSGFTLIVPMSETTYELTPPPGARGRGDPHHPRGGGRVRAARAAVLGRQGLDRHAAPGREGVLPRPACPFPVMHVDTGHNFPEVIEFRDRMVDRARRPPRRRHPCRTTSTTAGSSRRPGPRASRNRLQTVTLLDAIEEHALRRRLRRRPPRRGEGPGQGAGVQLPRRVRPVGPEEPAARAVEPLQRPAPQGRAHPGVPALELDRARHLAVHRRARSIELPSIYFAHRREVFQRDGMWLADSARSSRACDGEEVEERTVRFRTVGDVTCTGAVESPAATLEEVDRRGRRHPPHRAGRHPRRRPHQRGRHGRSQAGGVLLMPRCCASPPPARSTTASPRSSGGCSTTPRRSSRTSSRRSSAQSRGWATSTRTSRCSPTACGPSASRASRSTSPTATSPRPSGSSSSPTPPGHIQYTRNMVTGASTADLALILVDARKGIARAVAGATRSSPRCCGIPHLVRVRQQDGPRRLVRGALRGDQGRVPRLRHEARHPRPHLHPGLGAARRQRRRPLAQHALVRGLVAAAPPRGGAHRVRPQPHRRRASRCST